MAKKAAATATAKPDTGWFQQDRFGMFIHWGTYALAARHEWVKQHERMDSATYNKYFDHFDPDLYDPREWARLAKRAGMKYFVITRDSVCGIPSTRITRPPTRRMARTC